MNDFMRGENWEAIVLWKKKGPLYSTFPMVTNNGLIQQGHIENKQLMKLKDGGYLQPFSRVQVTLGHSEEFKRILQVDGLELIKQGQGNLNAIAYLAFLGELIFKLFSQGEGQRELYWRLKGLISLLQEKPIPLGVIIMGWQAMQLAGFLPAPTDYAKHSQHFVDELARISGIRPQDLLVNAIGRCLSFTWSSPEQINFTKQTWYLLEKYLHAYGQSQIGEPLETIKFLEEMNCSIFIDN